MKLNSPAKVIAAAAAAKSLELHSLGVENNNKYFEMALKAIPKLTKLDVEIWKPKNNKKSTKKIILLQ